MRAGWGSGWAGAVGRPAAVGVAAAEDGADLVTGGVGRLVRIPAGPRRRCTARRQAAAGRSGCRRDGGSLALSAHPDPPQ